MEARLSRLRVKRVQGTSITRCWIAVPSTAERVMDLQRSMALAFGVPKRSLLLSIEGFDLPPSQPINIIRENDVVVARLLLEDPMLSESSGRKRKRSSQGKLVVPPQMDNNRVDSIHSGNGDEVRKQRRKCSKASTDTGKLDSTALMRLDEKHLRVPGSERKSTAGAPGYGTVASSKNKQNRNPGKALSKLASEEHQQDDRRTKLADLSPVAAVRHSSEGETKLENKKRRSDITASGRESIDKETPGSIQGVEPPGSAPPDSSDPRQGKPLRTQASTVSKLLNPAEVGSVAKGDKVGGTQDGESENLETAKEAALKRLLGARDCGRIRKEEKSAWTEQIPNLSSKTESPSVAEQLREQLAELVEVVPTAKPCMLTRENAIPGMFVNYSVAELSFDGGGVKRLLNEYSCALVISRAKDILTIRRADETLDTIHFDNMVNPTIAHDAQPPLPAGPPPSRVVASAVSPPERAARKACAPQSTGIRADTQDGVSANAAASHTQATSMQSRLANAPVASLSTNSEEDTTPTRSSQKGELLNPQKSDCGSNKAPSREKLAGEPNSSQPMVGKVKRWLTSKYFGFITTKDHGDVFTYWKALVGGDCLEEGKSVEIHVELDEAGKMRASRVSGEAVQWVDGGKGRGANCTRRTFKAKGDNFLKVTGLRSWCRAGKLADEVVQVFGLDAVGFVDIDEDTGIGWVPLQDKSAAEKIGVKEVPWEAICPDLADDHSRNGGNHDTGVVVVTACPERLNTGQLASTLCQVLDVDRVGYVDVNRAAGYASIPIQKASSPTFNSLVRHRGMVFITPSRPTVYRLTVTHAELLSDVNAQNCLMCQAPGHSAAHCPKRPESLSRSLKEVVSNDIHMETRSLASKDTQFMTPQRASPRSSPQTASPVPVPPPAPPSPPLSTTIADGPKKLPGILCEPIRSQVAPPTPPPTTPPPRQRSFVAGSKLSSVSSALAAFQRRAAE
ncbi:hypothetical protein DIPPA_02326 [Diplonema papillatum]|nr:hypothetical protein DIPPA_02326 [Diplonema papillatum]